MTSLLERAWAEREEQVYPRLFGDLGTGIYTLDAGLFEQVFRETPDPRWLHIGVFVCPPSGERTTWLYVSSGLSNPWDSDEPPAQPETPSWLGTELFLETNEPGDWGVRVLKHMIAFQILLAHDRYPGKEPLGYWDRIPLGGPINGDRSDLRWAVVVPPAPYPDYFDLESGRVGLLRLVGASENEVDVLRKQGDEAFLQLLGDSQADRVTDPSRRCAAPGI